MCKTLLLLHRKACQRPEVQEAVDRVQAAGADLTVRVTWQASDLEAFVRDGVAAGVTRFVAGGGDGTVNGVANAIMAFDAAADLSLGVLPLGTANDFARGAGLPLEDLAEALHVAVNGDARLIDLGRIDDRYFINVASGGFGAEITAMTPNDLKALLGGAAYTLVGLAKVWALEPYRCSVRLDAGAVEELDVAVLAVGNNRYAGGGYDVAPRADVSDGLLDFAALTGDALGSLRAAVTELAAPAQAGNRFFRYAQARRCILESDRPLQLNLDGEPMVAKRFEFEVVPDALRCVLGRTSTAPDV